MDWNQRAGTNHGKSPYGPHPYLIRQLVDEARNAGCHTPVDLVVIIIIIIMKFISDKMSIETIKKNEKNPRTRTHTHTSSDLPDSANFMLIT